MLMSGERDSVQQSLATGVSVHHQGFRSIRSHDRSGPENLPSFRTPYNLRRECGNAEDARSRVGDPILYVAHTTAASLTCRRRAPRAGVRRATVRCRSRMAPVHQRATDVSPRKFPGLIRIRSKQLPVSIQPSYIPPGTILYRGDVNLE